MAAIIFNGAAGDKWTNDTDKVYYQFQVKWEHTCGACAQYHLAIANNWPIPLHIGCRCKATPIFPGKSGEPWCDFWKLAEGLDHENQVALVGAGNWKLIESGVVQRKDVITQYRVRDLHEVVSRNRLTVPQMTKAGIPELHAKTAFATVNTPAHVLFDQKRQELIKKVLSKGVSKEDLAQAFGERISQAIQIKDGPSGPQMMPATNRRADFGAGGLLLMPHTPWLPFDRSERRLPKPDDEPTKAIEQWAKDVAPIEMVPESIQDGEEIPVRRKRSPRRGA